MAWPKLRERKPFEREKRHNFLRGFEKCPVWFSTSKSSKADGTGVERKFFGSIGGVQRTRPSCLNLVALRLLACLRLAVTPVVVGKRCTIKAVSVKHCHTFKSISMAARR